MKPGPPPKPTRLKILAGNPGKRKLNEREPQPSQGKLTCPSSMPAEGKKEWKRVVPELDRLGVATNIDQAALEHYCTSWATWRHALKVIAKEGEVLMGPSGSCMQTPIQRLPVTLPRNLWLWQKSLV